MQTTTTTTPDPTDVHVGTVIRRRRRYLNISQVALAGKLGVTFQQVQKYERGANRVSASMLLRTARALGVGVAYFYDGLEGALSEKPPTEEEAQLRAFMEDERMRKIGEQLQGLNEAQRKAAFAAILALSLSITEIVALPRGTRVGQASSCGGAG